ncbi:MAG: hypothetical protein DRP15_01020 [Candidatus Aenigmatarchaeota archaeon]|nr:MAG: hypothetical protein DRP15_01020 [Candidatus Aenigmarchaeota archaeon]
MEFVIRNFKPEDLDVITMFKQESGRISFPDSKIDLEMFKRSLLSRVRKDPETVKVIEKDGEIIGYIYFFIKKTLTGTCGYIEHVFVRNEHRGKGLGKLLMKEAERYFKSKGIKRIRATVTLSNQTSLAMCRSLGYKEKRIILEKEL